MLDVAYVNIVIGWVLLCLVTRLSEGLLGTGRLAWGFLYCMQWLKDGPTGIPSWIPVPPESIRSLRA